MAFLRRCGALCLVALGALAASPVAAHPHIFVDATATLTFDTAGRVVSVHNTWTFDAAYSAWSVQGLDLDNDGKLSRDELQPLADDNMNGLADYSYYTFLGEGRDPNLVLGHGVNATLAMQDGRTTLSFDVPLATPYAIRSALEVSIADPEYYVAITFKDASAVSLVNAPANCSVHMEQPKELPPALADALYALPPDVTKLPPELEQALRGTQGAIVVDCPGGSATGDAAATVPADVPAASSAPQTARDAADALATAPSAATPASTAPATGDQLLAGNIPFGAAPNEPGLNLPRTGILGAIQQLQQDFYMSLQSSLAALRTDWTAFWVLGLVAFLYGVFHAAGPGHGKVVISSYVLANEAQMRRGVLLSFLAAMLQSLVAIGFVLVAASLLGMTAMAMSDAANVIGLVSYGLIALLGLWLIVRKVFGLGHRHGLAPAPLTGRWGRDRSRAPAHALAASPPPLARFGSPAGGADAYGRLPGHAHYGHAHGDHDHHHDHGHGHDHDHDHDHDHVHVVTPDALRGGWREQLGVVLAVGIRPCSGALIVLAFALSQGLLVAGIVAVLLMGVGTALTTGVLAAAAVGFKSLARTIAGADNRLTGVLLWWAELMAAVAVFAFGVLLILANLPTGTPAA